MESIRYLKYIIIANDCSTEKFAELFEDFLIFPPAYENDLTVALIGDYSVTVSEIKSKIRKIPGSGLWIAGLGDIYTLRFFSQGQVTLNIKNNKDLIDGFDLDRWRRNIESYDGDLAKVALKYLSLPKKLVKEFQNLPIEETVTKLKELRTTLALNALKDFPYDQELITKILYGEEFYWEVGEVYMLLRSIGVTSLYCKWYDKYYNEQYVFEEDDPSYTKVYGTFWEETRKENYLARVLSKVDFSEVPLARGAFSYPLKDIHNIYRLAFFLDDGADPAILIELPKKAKYTLEWLWFQEFQIRPYKGKIGLGFRKTTGKWDTLKMMRKLGYLLTLLPDKTKLELIITSKTKGANQKYRGQINAKNWEIDHIYPKISKKVFTQALELSNAVGTNKPLKALDKAEGKLIIESAHQDEYLIDYEVYLQDLTLQMGKESFGGCFFPSFMGQCIFRQRFGKYWPNKEIRQIAPECFK